MLSKSRKLRPRSQPFQARVEPGLEERANISNSSLNESIEFINEQRKELKSWDAFKEENHEVLEQLPLSLHRQLKLIHELEIQNEAVHAELLSSVRRYVDLRQDLMRRSGGLKSADLEKNLGTTHRSVDLSGSQIPANDDTTTSLGSTQELSYQPKHCETTRGLLQHIAQTSEESLRAAEEKVSIAQAAYETVDRHIRLLDQAIKEQEAAISLGMRLGTHLAPILLPDIVAVPRWARPARVEHSPLSLTPEPDLFPVNQPVVSEPMVAAPSLALTEKGKRITRSEPEPRPQEELMPPAHVASSKSRSGVKSTISTSLSPGGQSIPVDQNEKRYCYCNQVSFGTMIACDNENCKLEWFHLGCTGLSDLPGKRSKWYCHDCKPKMIHISRQRS